MAATAEACEKTGDGIEGRLDAATKAETQRCRGLTKALLEEVKYANEGMDILALVCTATIHVLHD